MKLSTKVDRPWGSFEQFTHNEISTVKMLEVSPGKRLSLQSHQNRDELWIALDNEVIVEINEQKQVLNWGDKIFIPRTAKHRLSSGSDRVRVLEISFGEFDEDDEVRYEDDFGRT